MRGRERCADLHGLHCLLLLLVAFRQKVALASAAALRVRTCARAHLRGDACSSMELHADGFNVDISLSDTGTATNMQLKQMFQNIVAD